MDTSELDEAKYLSLTTFTRDGAPKPAPLWFVGSGGRYQMTTDADAWKVKRIRNTPDVWLEVCDIRGEVAQAATRFEARAELTDDAGSARIDDAVMARYGLAGKAIMAIQWVGRKVRRQPPRTPQGIELTVTGAV
ncbi:MAG: PPOX class F420-dependent oxidoreductase [Actinomycetota bacterium]